MTMIAGDQGLMLFYIAGLLLAILGMLFYIAAKK